MSVLVAAVVLVGLLVGLDLILTVGVIKRLREHTELLSGGGDPQSLKVGDEVGEFAATTVDGEPVSRERLADGTLVGFFSPTCEPCKAKLPKFVEFARTLPGGRDRALAVVVGDPDDAVTQIAALSAVARVVFEENNEGEVCSAFEVMAFPSVLRVGSDGHGHPVVTDDQVTLDQPAHAAV